MRAEAGWPQRAVAVPPEDALAPTFCTYDFVETRERFFSGTQGQALMEIIKLWWMMTYIYIYIVCIICNCNLCYMLYYILLCSLLFSYVMFCCVVLWYGVVWCGVVRNGMAWYGMIVIILYMYVYAWLCMIIYDYVKSIMCKSVCVCVIVCV